MDANNINRVVAYFLVVGHGEKLELPPENANGEWGGGGEAACQSAPASPAPTAAASSSASPPRPSYLDRMYVGQVLARFPPQDNKSCPFPVGISMFALPDGIRLSTTPSLPRLYYFATTQGNGARVYGACLQFWEVVPEETIEEVEREEQRRQQERAQQQQQQQREASVSRSFTASSFAAAAAVEESKQRSPSHSPHNKIRTLAPRDNTLSSSANSSSAAAAAAAAAIPVTPAVHPALPATSSASTTSSTLLPPPRPPRGSITLSSFTPPPKSRAGSATASPVTSRVGPPGPSIPPATPAAAPALTPPKSKQKPRPAIYAPKCICILSLHPYLEQFRVFLTELYRMSLTPSRLPLERFISNFTLEVPLPPLGRLKYEYAISNKLLYFQQNPPNCPLKFVHSVETNRASRVLTLFELLDLEHILFVVECLLLEKRVLFLSSKLSLLTMVSEIFLHLLYPFRWRYVYIPLLPRPLMRFLSAPLPFIIGMHPAWVEGHLHGDVLVELVVVNLDENRIQFNNAHSMQQQQQQGISCQKGGSGQHARTPSASESMWLQQGHVHHFLPAKERKKLKQKLKPFQALFSRAHLGPSSPSSPSSSSHHQQRPPHQAYQLRLLDELDLAFPNAPHPDELDSIAEYSALVSELHAQEDTISLSFFRCFVSMLRDYKECIIYPTTKDPFPKSLFNLDRFLRKSGVSDAPSVAFYRSFVETQAFREFIEDRILLRQRGLEGQSDAMLMDPSAYAVRFFDESILAKRNRSTFALRQPTPFLEDDRFTVRRVVRVPPPEEVGLPEPVEVLSPTINNPNHKRVKPFMFVYNTFPRQLKEEWLWGERLRPPQQQQPQPQKQQVQAQQKAPVSSSSPASSSSSPSPATPTSPCPIFPSSTSTLRRPLSNPLSLLSLDPSSLSLMHPACVVELLWFTLGSELASSMRSLSLLQLLRELLEWRVQQVVSERQALEQVGKNWRTWSTPYPPHLVPPPEEVFMKVMRACGACNVSTHAIDIYQCMKNLEEYSSLADQAVAYGMLVNIFSEANDQKGLEALDRIKGGKGAGGTVEEKNKGNTTPFAPRLQEYHPSPDTELSSQHGPDSPLSISRFSSRAFSPSFSTPSGRGLPSPSITRHVRHGSHQDLFSLASSPSAPQGQSSQGLPPLSSSATGRLGYGNELTVPASSHRNSVSYLEPVGGNGNGTSAHSLTLTNDSLTSSLDSMHVDSQLVPRFQALFPSYTLAFHSSCPQCSHELSDHSIRNRWRAVADEATTACPKCGKRFVARFTVRKQGGENKEEDSSSEDSAPLSVECDYLSPHSLHPQLMSLLENGGILPFTTPSIRSTHPTLFFNLVLHCLVYEYPTDFLVRPESFRPETSSEGVNTTPATKRRERGASLSLSKEENKQVPSALEGDNNTPAQPAAPASKCISPAPSPDFSAAEEPAAALSTQLQEAAQQPADKDAASDAISPDEIVAELSPADEAELASILSPAASSMLSATPSMPVIHADPLSPALTTFRSRTRSLSSTTTTASQEMAAELGEDVSDQIARMEPTIQRHSQQQQQAQQ